MKPFKGLPDRDCCGWGEAGAVPVPFWGDSGGMGSTAQPSCPHFHAVIPLFPISSPSQLLADPSRFGSLDLSLAQPPGKMSSGFSLLLRLERWELGVNVGWDFGDKSCDLQGGRSPALPGSGMLSLSLALLNKWGDYTRAGQGVCRTKLSS